MLVLTPADTHTHVPSHSQNMQNAAVDFDPRTTRVKVTLHYITLHRYIHTCVRGRGREREREREREGGEASERESRTATASEIDKQTDKHERSITLNSKP